jgi:hypothetical protein
MSQSRKSIHDGGTILPIQLKMIKRFVCFVFCGCSLLFVSGFVYYPEYIKNKSRSPNE